MYGLMLKNSGDLQQATHVLRRFQLPHSEVSKAYSVVFRFRDVEDCLRSLQALAYNEIRARIIYHIFG